MNIDKIAPIPPNKAPAPTKQCKKHNNLYLFCNQTPPVLFSFITVMELYGIDDNPLTSYVSVLQQLTISLCNNNYNFNTSYVSV